MDDPTHAGVQTVSDCVLRGLVGMHQYDWSSNAGNCLFSKREYDGLHDHPIVCEKRLVRVL